MDHLLTVITQIYFTNIFYFFLGLSIKWRFYKRRVRDRERCYTSRGFNLFYNLKITIRKRKRLFGDARVEEKGKGQKRA